MENRNLPILHENSSLSVFPAYRQAGVPRMSPCLLGANLPARSRFGVGRWVVKIVLNVDYFLFSVITCKNNLNTKPTPKHATSQI